MMYGYHREKLQVNNFWELKGQTDILIGFIGSCRQQVSIKAVIETSAYQV